MSVFVGLGSNLNDPAQQVQQAIEALAQIADTQLSGISRLYSTAPVGYDDQPDFVNAVVRCETSKTPKQFLEQLQNIETHFGRVRTDNQNGPRTLDLDLLLFDDQIITTEMLIVPHPRMTQRAFVLYPLADIDPELQFPDGTYLEDVLATVPDQGVRHYFEEVI